MRKQTPVVEWKMVENDAEWDRLCAPAAQATQPGRATQHFYVNVIVSILFLAGATLWRWRVDQAAASQSTAELTATVQQELALGAQPADRPPPNDVGSQHGTDA